MNKLSPINLFKYFSKVFNFGEVLFLKYLLFTGFSYKELTGLVVAKWFWCGGVSLDSAAALPACSYSVTCYPSLVLCFYSESCALVPIFCFSV